MNTCKLQPRLCLGHMQWWTEHSSELMLQPPILCPLPLPWLLVCLALITTSWISFADISTRLPLNPCAFPPSFSLCLSQLSALFYKQSSDTVSQRHTSSPALAGCQAGSAVTVGMLGTHRWTRTYSTQARTDRAIQCCVQTHMHECEHRASDQSGRSTRERSVWPHLDLTHDTSLAPSQLIQLDRCVFLRGCVCVRALTVILMHILYEAAECMSETRTWRRPKYTLVKCGCVSLPAVDEFVYSFHYLFTFSPFSFLSLPYHSASGLILKVCLLATLTYTYTHRQMCTALTKGRQTNRDHLSHLRTLSV